MYIWHSQPKFPCPVNPIFNCNCLNDLDLDMDRDLGVSAGRAANAKDGNGDCPSKSEQLLPILAGL